METRVARTAKILRNVTLGEGCRIEDFVILGHPPKEYKDGELPMQIGPSGIVRSHSVIYAGNQIGENFQTGHGVMVRESNRIGSNVSIGTHSIVEHHVQIGNGVRIHSNAFVPEFSVLEELVWIGPGVVLTNARYPVSSEAKNNLVGPRIMKMAKIGANSTILPGVTIGTNALIGAGSVVVDDVPEGKVVAGNPARVIKDIHDLPDYFPMSGNLDA
jgi:acetyltransferase-like isoleucine patch superfamily enzyme